MLRVLPIHSSASVYWVIERKIVRRLKAIMFYSQHTPPPPIIAVMVAVVVAVSESPLAVTVRVTVYVHAVV